MREEKDIAPMDFPEYLELQQIIDMLYVEEIAEKFLSTLLLMFISSCYFIYNAGRDELQRKNLIL